jgi:hypothetical protein
MTATSTNVTKRHCPVCGHLLRYVDGDPEIDSTYICSARGGCGSEWHEATLGVVPAPIATMELGSPADQVLTFLRNTMAGSNQGPQFGDDWSVIGIDSEPSAPGTLWVHLDNGARFRLDVDYVEDWPGAPGKQMLR